MLHRISQINHELRRLQPTTHPFAAQILPLLKDFPTLWKQLTAVEQRILTGLYGLHGEPACTAEELSQQLGLSVQRVHQLEQHALSQLRRHGKRLVEYWR